MKKFPIYKLKNLLKLINIIQKVLQGTYSKNTYEGATQKQSTSKQKKKRYKAVSNLF